MFITQLKITNFRNLKLREFEFTNKTNVFYGNNGVGKTSILESIHYLSSGKSFRKGNFKNLINYDAQDFTVFLKYSENNETQQHSLAVNKTVTGKWSAKKNSKAMRKQSDISSLFPVVSIDPEVYRLVDFGPLYRRNFLDWMVFHVKHEYLDLWRKTHKCVKQLNTLYKTKTVNAELVLWENAFVEFSNQLNTIRIEAFKTILPNILSLSSYMQKEITNLNISYKKGWLTGFELPQQLIQDRPKNILYGKLQHGPHKMDIDIKIGNLKASEVLSRGQKKILSISFYMAYIKYLSENKIKPILCLDDLDAELDEEKLTKAAEFFEDINTQIFITSVTPDKIKKVFKHSELFHVEHY